MIFMSFYDDVKMAAFYKKEYPSGTRIELEFMDDPHHPVPPGTRGTVRIVDDAGSLHIDWDNGRRLAVLPSVDRFRKLSAAELEEEHQKSSLEKKIHQANNAISAVQQNHAVHSLHSNERTI